MAADNETKSSSPRWIILGTALAGLVATICVAATKYYELQKARADVIKEEPASVRDKAEPKPSQTLQKVTPKLVGTVWKGSHTFDVEYPARLTVTSQLGTDWRGIVIWNYRKDPEAEVEVEGSIHDQAITFRLTHAVRGGAFVILPATFVGTIRDKQMMGEWTGKSGKGTFSYTFVER